MIYRLKELQGDTIAVPQLVFSKLGIAEEYNVRVALYVLAKIMIIYFPDCPGNDNFPGFCPFIHHIKKLWLEFLTHFH